MQFIVHKASDRGFADHGWLQAAHSFSFAGYYNPEKIHFGVLRVLNDDIVAPGMGFGQHPHDNMEIITIPLSGAVKHKDSMGNEGVIQYGEVQVMSAGAGVTHSEFNNSRNEYLKLLQIWIFPNKKNVTPRYDQIKYDIKEMHKNWLQLVSPSSQDNGTWIYQDAWIHMGIFEKNDFAEYELHNEQSGVYIFVISGKLRFLDNELNTRDAIGIWQTKSVRLNFESNTQVLIIEVPMVN